MGSRAQATTWIATCDGNASLEIRVRTCPLNEFTLLYTVAARSGDIEPARSLVDPVER
jgi:hypothetical protein